MKNKNIIVSAAFSFMMLLTPAFAQTAKVKVDVPFEFEVGKQTFPAGEYSVSVLTSSFLRIQHTDGPESAMVLSSYMAGGPNQDNRPRIIFHHYSDRYFLAEVFSGDGYGSHEIFTSPAELRYARVNQQTQKTLMANEQSTK